MERTSISLEPETLEWLRSQASGRDIRVSTAAVARSVIEKAERRSRLAAREDGWGSWGAEGTTPEGQVEAQRAARDAAFASLVDLFGNLEQRGLIAGSGHDMAQAIAGAASRMVGERWRDE